MKLADFGISKKAVENITALRTRVYTLNYAAPEVLGFAHSDDIDSDSYTNAVDIWSLGVIVFLIFSGELPFPSPAHLGRYINGRYSFPSEKLLANNIDSHGCKAIEVMLAPSAHARPRAEECLQDSWWAYFPKDDNEMTSW